EPAPVEGREPLGFVEELTMRPDSVAEAEGRSSTEPLIECVSPEQRTCVRRRERHVGEGRRDGRGPPLPTYAQRTVGR
ncbi:MAG TPA: hypothetical protein VKW77_04260, partial [Acidimicrobiales bacterium]|nr:hypothetical protein [Acidimicrobiales bacterium]